jgi:hypothetical protein
MKLRYIGPDDPEGVELVCSGVSYGVVKADEVVEVPDEVYKAHAWSEELWAEVAPPKSKKGDA